MWVQRPQSPHCIALRSHSDEQTTQCKRIRLRVHAMITTVRRQWLLSSPYITLLINYAVTEDANRAMGLFGLVLCLLSLHGGYAQIRGRYDLLRWLACVEQSWIRLQSDLIRSTLLAASQLDRRAESRRLRSVLAKIFTFRLQCNATQLQ